MTAARRHFRTRAFRINYATNLPGRSMSHTGTEVRLAAQGPQPANVVGITDQTDLNHTLARALNVE